MSHIGSASPGSHVATTISCRSRRLFVSQLRRLQRIRQLIARRYREDVRSNWSEMSIRLWLMYIFVFTHWSGLMWAYMGTHGAHGSGRAYGNGTWIEAYTSKVSINLDQGNPLTAERLATDVPTLYLRSVYWATITLTTVGYGDIAPSASLSAGEHAVAMVVMIAGLMLYLLLSAESAGRASHRRHTSLTDALTGVVVLMAVLCWEALARLSYPAQRFTPFVLRAPGSRRSSRTRHARARSSRLLSSRLGDTWPIGMCPSACASACAPTLRFDGSARAASRRVR